MEGLQAGHRIKFLHKTAEIAVREQDRDSHAIDTAAGCCFSTFRFQAGMSEKQNVSWVWWYRPIIPALWKAESGRSL